MSNLRSLTAGLESSEFDTTDVMVLRLRGRERISQPFWFELEIAMRGGAALPEGASPGAQVTIVLRDEGVSPPAERTIHGIIEVVHDALDAYRKHRTYRVRVVPELVRTRLVETQEVYLDQTVPEIIAHKLDLHGLGGERLVVHAEGCPKRDFVVQYRESDLDFVSRLAEHLGVSFVFDHRGEGRERVIFTDDPVRTGIADVIDRVAFRTGGEQVDVFELSSERSLHPTTFVVQDYNYRTPLVDITGKHQLERDGAPFGNGGGVVEYGTHHKNQADGDRLAQIRAEERLCAAEIYRGRSAVIALTAGAAPTITGHPILGDVRVLVVEVEHAVRFGEDGSALEDGYRNSFEAVSASLRYRPRRLTARPRIHGFVTGHVALGAPGEIGGRAQLDAEGRYVVQMHFDTVTHEGQEKASHPIRMAQPFAGPNHGMHFPLRPGAEVILAFLDGDPDRPIIVGSVPNAVARSATTAANAQQNRIQSATGIIVQFTDNR
jgi:type VI secretion system secreted protein VgrG